MLKKVIREKDKEKLDMNVFKELGKDLNYKDILQVDERFQRVTLITENRLNLTVRIVRIWLKIQERIV